MNPDYLRQNWGLAVAAVLFVIVLLAVLRALYQRSARGQLAATARRLRAARRAHRQADAKVTAAEKRLVKLGEKASSVKPRIVTEAQEALADARALAKIADDQVLIAANHVRKVIYLEYPPERHEALRKKYLPDDKPQKQPFSF